MENMRIGQRLLLGFGALVAIGALLGVFALARYSVLQGFNEDMFQRDYSTTLNILTLASNQDQMSAARARALSAALLRRDKQPSDSPEALRRRWMQLRDHAAQLLAELTKQSAEWERTALTPQREAEWRTVRATLAEAARAFQAILPEADAFFAHIDRGDVNAATQSIAAVDRVAGNYENRLREAYRAIQEQVQLGQSEVRRAGDDTRTSVLLMIVGTLLIGLILSWTIHRSIVHPLRDFSRVIENVGRGDLTQHIEHARQDEIGELGRSLDRMTQSLKEVALQTRTATENLNTATAEILASAQQQAASTAEQAAAVQQANATMAEITQAGAQISERARQVATAAQAASSASEEGMESVRNTLGAMENIRQQAEAVAENVVALSEKTQAIGDIITTVNDIAEQSHLLAVNAAIQAAAAGEHGRSFAVVANEMKNLAGQSKQATIQVRSILGDIQRGITTSVMMTEEAVKRAESGREQASQAERTIQDLTENTEESIRAFQQIVGGSGQQQIGFEQVTQAFRNIGIASQETATSTKQLEKAASNLTALSMQLREAVGIYKL
jgi:methyl-accepting chemotaxis protein